MIKADKVWDIIHAEGIYPQRQVCADEAFSLPTRKWFVADFAEALRIFYASLRNFYGKQSQDCDDWARGAAWFASFLHNRTRPNLSALAVGEMWYNRDYPVVGESAGDSRVGGPHAIIFAVVKERRYEVLFLEPQTSVQLFLTKSELQSVEMMRL